MSAELFINLPVLSFAEQMQLDLTHDRAVLIGIEHQKLGSVQCYNAQLIIEIARCARHSCAKKTVALNFLGRDRPGCLSIRHDFDLARIGPENADHQIVADTVRPQDAERIGMRSCEKAVQFVGRQAGDLERFHSYTLHRKKRYIVHWIYDSTT